MKYEKKQTDFLVYCIELYKSEKSISGKEVANLFTETKLSEYILSNFDSLHTYGEKYLIEDFDSFIKNKEK